MPVPSCIQEACLRVVNSSWRILLRFMQVHQIAEGATGCPNAEAVGGIQSLSGMLKLLARNSAVFCLTCGGKAPLPPLQKLVSIESSSTPWLMTSFFTASPISGWPHRMTPVCFASLIGASCQTDEEEISFSDDMPAKGIMGAEISTKARSDLAGGCVSDEVNTVRQTGNGRPFQMHPEHSPAQSRSTPPPPAEQAKVSG